MNRSQSVRRIGTVVGVVVALVLGFGSIRAAAAWTAAAAPLTVTPDSVSLLQSRLADELSRSAALQQQLDALESQSTDLAAALDAARTRIGADAAHASAVAAQLKTAKQRLTKLQATIAAANHASQASATKVTVGQAAVTPSSASIGGEPGDNSWGGSDD